MVKALLLKKDDDPFSPYKYFTSSWLTSTPKLHFVMFLWQTYLPLVTSHKFSSGQRKVKDTCTSSMRHLPRVKSVWGRLVSAFRSTSAAMSILKCVGFNWYLKKKKKKKNIYAIFLNFTIICTCHEQVELAMPTFLPRWMIIHQFILMLQMILRLTSLSHTRTSP